MSASNTATFLSLILTAGFVLVLAIATRDTGSSILGAFLGLLVFMFMGWFPIWIGSVLALIAGVYFTGFIRNRFRD